MNIKKHSRLMVVLVLLAGILLIVFTQVERVKATFSDMHAAVVLLRVQSEIMQKSPAGQYYESLFWKHNDELMRISSAYPENRLELMRITRMFIPGLESLLEGNGDTVRITAEQVEGLNSYLNWLVSVGHASLQEDIMREQQRLPLEYFAGRTMDEALELINSNWSSDSIVEKTLVQGSDGKWAYYVHNGVYLEYPGSYNLQVSGTEKDFIYFMPSTGSPAEWNPCVMKVRVWRLAAGERDSNYSHPWYSDKSVVWQTAIQNEDFQGFEFIVSIESFPVMEFHAFQYNEEHEIAADIWVFVNENPQVPNDFDYPAMLDQRYEYFQHMAHRLQIQSP